LNGDQKDHEWLRAYVATWVWLWETEKIKIK
jgi:hypothetical protein